MDPGWQVVGTVLLAVWTLGTGLLVRAFAGHDRRINVHDRRINDLETHAYTREDAAKGRSELKQELQRDIAHIEKTLQTHRVESNAAFTQVFQKFDTLTASLFQPRNKPD